jgi:DNA-binding transcriptional LysR family regulator
MHTYAENTFFIGCLTSFGCQEAFREVVKKFGEIFPWIELSTGIFEYAELKRRLLSGKIQLAIMTSFLLSGIQNISHKNIKKSELFIGLSTSHPLAAKEALRVSDLKDELFYHISPEIPVDSTVRGFEICVKSGFYPKHILRFPNLATLLDALEQGGGVVICDKIVDAEYERKIKLVPIDESDSAHYYSAVWRTIDFSGIIKNFVSLL